LIFAQILKPALHFSFDLIVGTWSSDANVPSYNGSITKLRVVFRFLENGQFTSDWAYAFNNGSTEILGQGTWTIQDGVLTMQVARCQSHPDGYNAPVDYGPAPQFDDGPSGAITFVDQNTFSTHGWTFIRN
jgi:hypothetical protein